ncbi:MAGE-domain-containing protein [Boletus edulis]|nr:MAGE-domain-containing protein [Boletus edulis]
MADLLCPNVDQDDILVIDDVTRTPRDLVRLALFSERKHVLLRREDINKKVLLRKTFAMELVELQARPPKCHRRQKKKGPFSFLSPLILVLTTLRPLATAAGSKTYILRSTLDPAIIDQAALSDERLLEEELAEVDLKANLERLLIPPGGTIPSNAQSTHRSMPVDTFLQQLVRQGYIDRVRLGDTKSTTGKRRGRHANGGGESGSEVGEQAIAWFVGEFMVERTRTADAEEEEEELYWWPQTGEAKAKEGGSMEKRLETVVKAIERAAGGNLTDVK